MELKFRKLNADEIDVRIATINDKGATLLLYKDARVDQTILDETVGAMNWQRHHARENANCIVAIWDADKKQWIEKEDTGTESFTEREKGLASDSFKRACFNWGIGRELYTAPFIWVNAGDLNISKGKDGKPKCYDHFAVTSIEYDADKIAKLRVVNTRTHAEIFSYNRTAGNRATAKPTTAPSSRITDEQAQAIMKLLDDKNLNELVICDFYGIGSLRELPANKFQQCMSKLNATERVVV